MEERTCQFCQRRGRRGFRQLADGGFACRWTWPCTRRIDRHYDQQADQLAEQIRTELRDAGANAEFRTVRRPGLFRRRL